MHERSTAALQVSSRRVFAKCIHNYMKMKAVFAVWKIYSHSGDIGDLVKISNVYSCNFGE